MKTVYKYILSLSLIFIAGACNDDFLDRFPETEIGRENFFNTEEDLAMYINNLYNFPGVGIYVSDRGTDNAATTGNLEIKTMMVSEANASTINQGWDWERLRTINFFLENFSGANLPEARLNHFEGLARFFRAQFYVEKVKRFSDVPWYDEVIDSDEEDLLFKGRDSREFVVERIMEDFEFAAEHVEEDSRAGAVDNWVVKAYYAQFAIYEGTFRKYHPELNLTGTANTFLQQARDLASDIMNNGGFSIYSTGNPMEDYQSLFVETGLDGNPEIILGTYAEDQLLNSGWWEYMFGNYEVCPAKDLLQSYLMEDGSYYTSQPDYETNLFVEEFENRDPRVYQTFAYPGWENNNTDTYSQGGGIYVQQLAKNFSGYHQIKGFVNNPDVTVQNSVDVPVIRYPEILLIYAEAKAELGELNQADLDMTVNAIRDRVGMPNLSMNPPVDQVQLNRYPNIQSATSQWATLLEIRRERRVELALEGYRFDDLMRWGAGEILEEEPMGIYFPSLGKFDLTGDDIPDVYLIPVSESIPGDKETNELGEQLIYYRAGVPGEDAGIFLENGTSGKLITVVERGTFEAPKYYYRPVPQPDVAINPNLEQILGWE